MNLDQPEHGLPKALLDKTDVLIWWGHVRHDAVPQALADDIVARVKAFSKTSWYRHPAIPMINERVQDDALRHLKTGSAFFNASSERRGGGGDMYKPETHRFLRWPE